MGKKMKGIVAAAILTGAMLAGCDGKTPTNSNSTNNSTSSSTSTSTVNKLNIDIKTLNFGPMKHTETALEYLYNEKNENKISNVSLISFYNEDITRSGYDNTYTAFGLAEMDKKQVFVNFNLAHNPAVYNNDLGYVLQDLSKATNKTDEEYSELLCYTTIKTGAYATIITQPSAVEFLETIDTKLEDNEYIASLSPIGSFLGNKIFNLCTITTDGVFANTTFSQIDFTHSGDAYTIASKIQTGEIDDENEEIVEISTASNEFTEEGDPLLWSVFGKTPTPENPTA